MTALAQITMPARLTRLEDRSAITPSVGIAVFSMSSSPGTKIRSGRTLFFGSAFSSVFDHRPDLGFHLFPTQVPLDPEMYGQTHSCNGCGAQNQQYKKNLNHHRTSG
jgi:hypothetical protein